MKKKIIILFIMIFIFSIILLYIYSSKISKDLLEYAKIESKKVGIEIISKNVTDEVVKILDNKDIFDIEKDNNGNIEMINYNTKVVNEILSISSKVVTNNFEKINTNEDGIIMRVPMGIISKNVFLENLGPKVPIKLNLNGNVLTSLKTNVKDYGLNSALVQISIKIEANVIVLVPLRSDEIKIVNEIPISIKIIEGNVSSLLSSNE